MIRLADYVMKRIYEENVDRLFFVPGGSCIFLTDALRRCEGIKGVSMHHEQAAAMAALSYALYENKMGACIVTTGCGGTNTITGILHAWQDSIPMIVVSGQQNYNLTIDYQQLPLRQVAIQEADTIPLVKPITKYAELVKDAKQIGIIMDRALHAANSGRKGPVWIDIPLDIQNSMIDEASLEREYYEEDDYSVNNEDLAFVVEALKSAKRPVLLAGHGISSAGAENELKQLVEKLEIPTVFTRYSIDMLPSDNKHNFGVVSTWAANRRANFIVQNSDLVLSIGSRLAIDTTGPQREAFARDAKVVVVDIDTVEHSKNGVKIDKFIEADAKEFICGLLNQNTDKIDEEWINKCNHWKEIFSDYDGAYWSDNKLNIRYVLHQISKYFPKNSCTVSSAGMTGLATPTQIEIKDGDRSLYSFSQGEMGYCIPGAIGVASTSDGTVFAISGEGSFMMNMQELQTVVRNNFNIKIIVNNNNGYSGVRHGQSAHFRGKTIGTDPSNGIDFPDLKKISAAFDIPYYLIERPEDIEKVMNEMVSINGPCFCEIISDPLQYDLHNALVMYGKRSVGFRPIEDQSPFLDRETFFEEMIVEPLETSSGTPI